MLLYRLGPEGLYAVGPQPDALRVLLSDPLETPPDAWELGREISLGGRPLPPVRPGKVLGVGRNYAAHAAELGNAPPAEPLLFLKSPSALVGPGAPVLLPPESERVDFEGEIAVVLRQQLRRADSATAAAAVLGVCPACDVTARDLQQRDRTFTRAKSFDSFCPLGPALGLVPPYRLDDLEVVTRVDGVERQRGHVREMTWSIPELLAYASRFVTLEPGDVILTGTPEGVGPLHAGARLEVEIPGLGVLANPVEPLRP